MPKPKEIDPEVVVAPSLDDVQVEVTMPVEEAKAEAKYECPDCGKMMSRKTLRHSHGPNCVVKSQQQATRGAEVQNVTNDLIE